MRRGALSAERYIDALITAAKEARGLNAFIALDGERAMEAARAADERRRRGEPLGALHGLPLGIKDNIAVVGLPLSGGTLGLRTLRPREDAPVVARLKAAGALVLAKTNLHELSMGWTGNNPHFGPTLNPHDPSRIAGGSSGGTAAAIAAGLAPAGLGTDTNGSLRIPAAFCGVASFRPSPGRYAMAGVVPLSSTFDTVGPMAREARDVALLDAVMAGRPGPRPRSSLEGVRIGILRDEHFSALEPAVATAASEVLRRLKATGAELIEVALPELAGLPPWAAYAIIHHEAARLLPAWLADDGERRRLGDLARSAGPDIRQVLEHVLMERGAQRIADERYAEALAVRARLRALVRECFTRHAMSLLALPVTRIVAPKAVPDLVSPAPDPVTALGPMSAREAYARNVALASLAGLPALVLPAARSPEGMPIGFEFDGPEGTDDAVLALGPALEGALGVIQRA